jgi:hypothetical protein
MSELGPSFPVTDLIVLAAVSRSLRHERVGGRSELEHANLTTIAHHLGWAYHSGSTRRLRPHLDSLVAAGRLEPYSYLGYRSWRMTSVGRRHLAAAGPVELPESPQHRLWRHTTAVAGSSLDSLRSEAAATVGKAADLLGQADPSPAELFESGECVRRRLRELGSALATLEEWPEPDDAERDACRPWAATNSSSLSRRRNRGRRSMPMPRPAVTGP